MIKPNTHYYQTAATYKYAKYGDSTIGRAGCGPTTAANVVKSLKGTNVTPKTACDFAYSHGYKAAGGGTSMSFFKPYFKKYGREAKKLEKRDISDIYYTFKDELKKKDSYSLVQIFCAIAEFFELNYKTLYNDIISLEDKSEILEALQESYGLESTLSSSKKLF